MTAPLNLTRLRALRAKMTPGEWRTFRHGSMGPRDFVMQMGDEPDNYEILDEDDAAGIVATHAAADTLIEITEAALAWKEARDASIGEAYLRCPGGPSRRTQQELSEAALRLDAALAKVGKEGT